LPQNLDIGLEVLRVRRADDGGVQVWVAEREAEDELHRGHTAKQILEFCPLPPLPLQARLLSLRRGSLRSATTDDDACSGARRSGNDRLVFAFHRRIGNLKQVEHSHRDVVLQVGQRAGHADVPYLAGCLELLHRLECTILLQGLLRWRCMELHHIEVVGLHPLKALLDTGEDVVAGEHVRAALAAHGRSSHQTAAFACQVILGATVRDITTDPLFAHAVIDRGIDVIDTGIEHGVEDGFRLRLGGVPRSRGAT